MLKNKFSFPHPVLTVDGDDIQPALCKDNVLVSNMIINDNNDYVLPVTLVVNNEGLVNDVKNGNAEYAIEIDCPSTLFRRCLTSSSEHFDIELQAKNISGRVYFQPYIIAKKDFKYSNDYFNQDYEDEIEIGTGEVLAIFNHFHHDFDLMYEQLKAYSSIMTIREGDESLKDIRYITDENLIIIELPQEKANQYKQFKADPNYTAAIHASLVHNALLIVLLQEDWTPVENEPLWKRTIRYRVEHEEDLKPYKNLSNKENLVMISNIMLRDPIKRLFDKIMSDQE